eukprot:jgi/Chrzof1/7770/Cz02g36040.t1
MSGKAIQAIDANAQKGKELPVTVTSRTDPDRKMKALEWRGSKSVGVYDVPKPMVTDPTDVILRVTSTAICGSDLHLFVGGVAGVKSGDVLGHEFMGIVEEVGDEVTKIQRGDRVVACFDIGCGSCYFCKQENYSCCKNTNPSVVIDAMWGQGTAGFYGYSHLTGGWQGGQAEYVRVPFADLNLLKVPEGVPDEQVLFLSDILPTAWHANELGEVHEGDVVAIWGAGPVGILAAHCAKHRGARRIVLIDNQTYRLEYAASKIPGLETIDFSKTKTLQALKELCANEEAGAPDVVIEAVGLHYANTLIHKVEMALMMETDQCEVLNECLVAVKKGGRVSIVGAYAGWTNHFNVGALMEKQLTIRGGQTPCQKYWPVLLDLVLTGQLDPAMVITHELPLEDAAKGYKLFNDKKDGCIKVVLKPMGDTVAPPAGAHAVSVS